jgi:hypothetical protein
MFARKSPMRLRVRPSKSSSLIRLIVGVVFICLGIFILIPAGIKDGTAWVGVVWTGGVAILVVRDVLNLSTERGVADEVIDVDKGIADSAQSSTSVEDRLRKLNYLCANGLISDAELKTRREEILREV